MTSARWTLPVLLLLTGCDAWVQFTFPPVEERGDDDVVSEDDDDSIDDDDSLDLEGIEIGAAGDYLDPPDDDDQDTDDDDAASDDDDDTPTIPVCPDVAAQSGWCLLFGSDEVWAVGLDDGFVCFQGTLGNDFAAASPAVGVIGELALSCSGGTLQQLDLVDHTILAVPAPDCFAVTAHDGQWLAVIHENGVPPTRVRTYPDAAALLADAHTSQVSLPPIADYPIGFAPYDGILHTVWRTYMNFIDQLDADTGVWLGQIRFDTDGFEGFDVLADGRMVVTTGLGDLLIFTYGGDPLGSHSLPTSVPEASIACFPK